MNNLSTPISMDRHGIYDDYDDLNSDPLGSDENGGSSQGANPKKSKSQLSVAAKLIAGMVALGLIGVVVGAIGFIYISDIDASLDRVTTKAAPMVETADDLVANIWESTKVAEEIIADEELEDIAELVKEFAALKTTFEVGYKELDAIVDDESLLDELQAVVKEHGEFVKKSEAMFATHIQELEEEILADELLAKFDETGALLITLLDEFAIENEAEMAKLEEEGDRLVTIPTTSASDLNDLLGSLFEEDYPVVEAALKLQRLVIEMQDTAGEYMATENPAELVTPASDFQALVDQAQPFFDTLHQLAESEEDKQDAVVLEETFDNWASQAAQEEQLFDTHRDMLRAEKEADDLTEGLEMDADAVAAALDVVVDTADRLSSQIDTEANELVANAALIISVAIVIVVLVTVGMIVMIVKTVTSPIVNMTEAMGSLAKGHFETEVPALGRADEIGDMASAVQIFKENGEEMKRLEAEQAQATERAEVEKRELMNNLANNFEAAVMGVVDDVSSASGNLQETSQVMTQLAKENQQQATSVSTASEEATSNVQSVASSTEELSASIQEIAKQVSHSTRISEQAVSAASQSNTIISGLASSAQQIGEVVELITDIAEQTNLLALNATIEAARAGDAGKGFAVVASEVKNLANQTAKATEQISQHIGGVQQEAGNAVDAVQSIERIITEMNEISTSIASAIEEQNSATSEIARSVDQARAGTQDVSSSIVLVSQSAEQAEQSANGVQSASDTLADRSTALRSEVEKFLGEIRTV